MVEIDGDTTNALHEFLRIYRARDYLSQLLCLCLAALLTLGSLGGMLYQSSGHRYVKLGASICLKLYLNLFVALHWQYRAKCTEKDSHAGHGFEWIVTFTGSGFDWLCFFVGCAILSFVFLNFIFEMYASAKSKASMIDFSAISWIFGSVPFTDGGMKDMVMGHLPIIVASAVVCGALTHPGIVCMLQNIHFLQALLCDVIFAGPIWTTRFAFLMGVVCTVDSCCCCGKGQKRTGKIYTQVMTRTATGIAISKATSILPPTTGVIANEHNVKTLPDIAEVKVPLPKYVKYKRCDWLWSYFQIHCTVNDMLPKDEHIEEAFKTKNLIYDPKEAKRLFLIKELERLGLLDPPPVNKKKK